MNQIESQVRKFYDEIWNRKNVGEIPNILHENVEFRGSIGLSKQGHRGFEEYVLLIHTALANYSCTIQELVIESNKAFAKMRFSGFHQAEFMGFPSTNKQVSWNAAALFTFSGNKISNLWVLGDVASLDNQLTT